MEEIRRMSGYEIPLFTVDAIPIGDRVTPDAMLTKLQNILAGLESNPLPQVIARSVLAKMVVNVKARIDDGTLPATIAAMTLFLKRELNVFEKASVTSIGLGESMMKEVFMNRIDPKIKTAGLFQLIPSTRSLLEKRLTEMLTGSKALRTRLSTLINPFSSLISAGYAQAVCDLEDETQGYAQWLVPSALLMSENLKDVYNNFSFSAEEGWKPVNVTNPYVIALFEKYPEIFKNQGSGLQALWTILHIQGVGFLNKEKPFSHPDRFLQDLGVNNSLIQNFKTLISTL